MELLLIIITLVSGIAIAREITTIKEFWTMGSLITRNRTAKKKTYSNKPEDMLALAKEYARKDFNQAIELIKSLGITIEDKTVADALISLKYSKIENVRNNRNTYFD